MMISEKKYSVLMSIYEKENPEFFKLSLESMIKQSLPPSEIVIVEDGKLPDKLEKVIEKYQFTYPDLFSIVHLDRNIGLGKALNEGLKVCKHELVARMDTDDISTSERCELQVNEFIENSNLTIIGSNINEFYNSPEEVVSTRVVPSGHEDILKFAKRRNPFNHPSVMYKKSKVLACGGYGDFRRNQDLDLFVRMLHNGCIGKNIDKSLLLFRANEDNFKRRKSYTKCKSYIEMIYHFWRNGYSSFFDFLIVLCSQILILLTPSFFLKWLSNNFLRKKVS
ncbi:glycosyl transferase [Oceanobacillus kimchii]|uniref:Glycosyl transferase n=2 Tax=Oceanobacillus kimchii TaxID=746691 RepID=A0ABQ5TL61_9BACI|nr:glycosyl transferase [Oceanobacillus kimchii]